MNTQFHQFQIDHKILNFFILLKLNKELYIFSIKCLSYIIDMLLSSFIISFVILIFNKYANKVVKNGIYPL